MFKTPEKRLDEIALYELVAEELERGEQSKGLWAKALAEGEGNIEKAKGLYIKLRVEMIIDEWKVAGQIQETSTENEKILSKAREESAISLANEAREVRELRESAKMREFGKKGNSTTGNSTTGNSRNVGVTALVLWILIGAAMFFSPILGIAHHIELWMVLLNLAASATTVRWLYLKYHR